MRKFLTHCSLSASPRPHVSLSTCSSQRWLTRIRLLSYLKPLNSKERDLSTIYTPPVAGPPKSDLGEDHLRASAAAAVASTCKSGGAGKGVGGDGHATTTTSSQKDPPKTLREFNGTWRKLRGDNRARLEVRSAIARRPPHPPGRTLARAAPHRALIAYSRRARIM